MAALSAILRSVADNRVAFWCPGCNSAHQVPFGAGSGPRWGYNGDVNAPTFTPSILVRTGHHVPGHDGGPCWCSTKDKDGEDWGFDCTICHSFVTGGQIQFLPDCTHALAGQTVPIPAWPQGD